MSRNSIAKPHSWWLIISAIFFWKGEAEMLIPLMIYRAKEVHTPVLLQILVYKEEKKLLCRSNLQKWREIDFKVCTNFSIWKKLGLSTQINMPLWCFIGGLGGFLGCFLSWCTALWVIYSQGLLKLTATLDGPHKAQWMSYWENH